MGYFISCFVLLLCVALHDAERYFRCDYTYFAEANGWLKFHEIPASWPDARLTCMLEGASLVSPTSPGLIKAMQYLMRRSSNTTIAADTMAVYTGFHSTYAMKYFASLEGLPLSEVEHKWFNRTVSTVRGSDCLAMGPEGELFGVDGEEKEYPFVCYKEYAKLRATPCETVDPDYVLESKLGSCYKYHGAARPWREAYKTCAAEGGHLVVPNSDTEAEYLRLLLRHHFKEPSKGKPRNCEEDCEDIENGSAENVLLVGVSRLHYPWMLLTIHDETPSDAGYFKVGQKHLAKDGKCVAIDERGYLVYVYCHMWFRFVCEKKPGKLNCDTSE